MFDPKELVIEIVTKTLKYKAIRKIIAFGIGFAIGSLLRVVIK